MHTLKLRRLAAIVFGRFGSLGCWVVEMTINMYIDILGGGFKYFVCSPLGKWSNLTCAYFSDRWLKPPVLPHLHQPWRKSSFGPARHYDLCCATLVLTNVTWHRSGHLMFTMMRLRTVDVTHECECIWNMEAQRLLWMISFCQTRLVGSSKMHPAGWLVSCIWSTFKVPSFVTCLSETWSSA